MRPALRSKTQAARWQARGQSRGTEQTRPSLASLFPIEENSNKNPLHLPFETANSAENFEGPVHAWEQGLGATWKMEITTPKPIVPDDEEIRTNPLARSCKLRAIEKVLL
jgi:hypothetical protein